MKIGYLKCKGWKNPRNKKVINHAKFGRHFIKHCLYSLVCLCTVILKTYSFVNCISTSCTKASKYIWKWLKHWKHLFDMNKIVYLWRRIMRYNVAELKALGTLYLAQRVLYSQSRSLSLFRTSTTCVWQRSRLSAKWIVIISVFLSLLLAA
jgi:hypothetical protein